MNVNANNETRKRKRSNNNSPHLHPKKRARLNERQEVINAANALVALRAQNVPTNRPSLNVANLRPTARPVRHPTYVPFWHLQGSTNNTFGFKPTSSLNRKLGALTKKRRSGRRSRRSV